VGESLASKAAQNSPFQSGRFEFGWAGLVSGGRLVMSGKGCCVVRRFLAGRRAAWCESTAAHRRSASSRMCRG